MKQFILFSSSLIFLTRLYLIFSERRLRKWSLSVLLKDCSFGILPSYIEETRSVCAGIRRQVRRTQQAASSRYDSRDTTNGSSIVGRLLIRCLVPQLKFTLRAEPASPLSQLLTLLLRQSTATVPRPTAMNGRNITTAERDVNPWESRARGHAITLLLPSQEKTVLRAPWQIVSLRAIIRLCRIIFLDFFVMLRLLYLCPNYSTRIAWFYFIEWILSNACETWVMPILSNNEETIELIKR